MEDFQKNSVLTDEEKVKKLRDSRNYNLGIEFLNKKEYKRAMAAFIKAEDFKDAKEKYEETKNLYDTMASKIYDEEIEEAYDALDSGKKIWKQRFYTAVSELSKIDDFGDTKDKIKDLNDRFNYRIAMENKRSKIINYSILGGIGAIILTVIAFTVFVPMGKKAIMKSEVKSGDYFIYDKDAIYFGNYPQSAVSKKKTIQKLNSMVELPNIYKSSDAEEKGWTSRVYYNTDTGNSGTYYYIDLDTNKDGSYDYRGVYGIEISTSYGFFYSYPLWFKYEPIAWKVLKTEDDKAYLLSENILDTSVFDGGLFDGMVDDSYSEIKYEHNGGTGYWQNWELSDLRLWLNNEFYNCAFSDKAKSYIELTACDNSYGTTWGGNNTYVSSAYLSEYEAKLIDVYSCNETEDNIFLLSGSEVLEYFYQDGYAENSIRVPEGTEYAKMTGVDNWWARIPGNTYYGQSNGYSISVSSGIAGASRGVRPACWIKIGK